MAKESAQIPDDVYELSVLVPANLPAGVEIVRQVLLSCGVSDGEMAESYINGRGSLSVYGVSRPGLQCLRRRIDQLSMRGLKVRERRLAAKDWQERWKKEIKPFALTPRLMVVPSWTTAPRSKISRTIITLDTTLAFGTGLHETTRFVSGLIEDCRGRFKSFLDIGTGSGILTIVALHSGAQTIRAIDIDPSSVDVARANLKANGFPADCVQTADLASWRERKIYDFVAANLTTRDLIERQKGLLARVRPGGFLALSGISLSRLKELRDAYRTAPLKCLRIRKGKEWAALLFRREPR